MKNSYIKYQLILFEDDPFFLDILNCYLIESNLGGIESVETGDREKLYLYLPENNYRNILKSIKIFCKNHGKKLAFNKIGVIDNSYLTKWMEAYKPIYIDEIVIAPSWNKIDFKEKIIVKIDPQLAFGTGQHESTQLAIKSILSVLSSNNINSLIDIGTGSGILSIVAYKKGVKNIYGIEIDKDAVFTAKNNFFKNNVENFYLVCGNLCCIKDVKFDLVVSNIISNVLIENRWALKKIVKSNGFLILSGILIDEKEKFINEFGFNNFHLVNEFCLNEWISFVLYKNFTFMH